MASKFTAFALYDTAGAPLTSAAPSFAVYRGSDGSTQTPPAISNLGGGLYAFTIPTPQANLGVTYLIANGAGAVPGHYAGADGGRVQAFAIYDLTGAPLAGRTPTFTRYVDTSGTALAQPSIADFGGGLYVFSPTLDQYAAGVGFTITCGTGVSPSSLIGSAQDPSGRPDPQASPSIVVPPPDEEEAVSLYARQLEQLLPRGVLFNLESSSWLTRVVRSLAAEFSRVDERAAQLVEELDPRTALETLPDWERVLGLPDSCLTTIPTAISERRQAVTSKLTARGGQSRQFYIDLAATLGYAITIQEFTTATAATLHAGDLILGEAWAYAWLVNLPIAAGPVNTFTATSHAGETLTGFVSSAIECILERSAPAHTTVLFSYT